MKRISKRKAAALNQPHKPSYRCDCGCSTTTGKRKKRSVTSLAPSTCLDPRAWKQSGE